MEDIAARIQELMQEKDMSSKAFSEEIGIQRSSLSHIFSGRNKPSLDLIIKLKKRFPEIDLNDLILGEAIETASVEEQNEAPKEENKGVTNVNNDTLDSDIQLVESNHKSKGSSVPNSKETDKIILLQSDGSFKEYFKES